MFLEKLIFALVSSSLTSWTANAVKVIKLSDGSIYSYDPRYQAGSVDEAIVSFPDLSMLNPPNPVDIQNPLVYPEGYCTSEECIVCQNDIRRRLKKIGLLKGQSVPRLHHTKKLICRRYLFTQEKALSQYYRKKEQHQSHDSSSGSDSSSSGSDNSSDDSDIGQHDNKRRKRSAAYSRRSISQQPLSMIGTRFNISCSTKGITVDTTGMVSLCSSCWVWRRLPANYFPQFINELVCTGTDQSCLSGYATCEIGTRAVSVLRNETDGTLTEVSLTAGNYCECKVKFNSVLESLITGDGMSHSLPPLNTVTAQ